MLGNVSLDRAHVETNNLLELINIAALALDKVEVRDRANTELSGKSLAVVDVDLDERHVRELRGELRQFRYKALARAAPWGEEVEDEQVRRSRDPGLQVVV